MTSQEAYRILEKKKERFPKNRAFFETARELGMSPSDLGKLFAKSKAERRREREEETGQGLLFS
jgi:hypothetical protein